MAEAHEWKQLFATYVIGERKNFLDGSLGLVRRRYRKRGLGLRGIAHPGARYLLVLWCSALTKLEDWGRELPESYEVWEADLTDGEQAYSYGFLATMLCKWWDRHPLFPVGLEGRVAKKPADLISKLYQQKDPWPYYGPRGGERDDPLLKSVVELVKKTLSERSGPLPNREVMQVGIGQARLGACWSGNDPPENTPIIPADYERCKCEPPECECVVKLKKKRGEWNTRDRDVGMEEDPAAPPRPVPFHDERALFFNPYHSTRRYLAIGAEEEEWSPVEEWTRDFPGSPFSVVVVAEVLHEVTSEQLEQFFLMLDEVTADGGVCVLQDLAFLPQDLENDFCIYRCDEIAQLFKALGWKAWHAPCWGGYLAQPFSLVLAVKDGTRPRWLARWKLRRIRARIRQRLVFRLHELLKFWKERPFHANEIPEHFMTLFSLANFVRWEDLKARKSRGGDRDEP